jgi:hypothetical protein
MLFEIMMTEGILKLRKKPVSAKNLTKVTRYA